MDHHRELKKIEQDWLAVAGRADIVDKEVTYRNGVGGTDDKGKISRIDVKDGRVAIHCSEINGEPTDDTTSEIVRFGIELEREPSPINGPTIFCDLDDDYRQITIRL